MINLEVKTKLSHDELRSRLKSFFGKGGLGLETTDDAQDCLSFEGGGGFVKATICQEDGKIRLELQTQEWEIQVKKFASSLP
ncbi:MAG: hypothetical protein JRF41_10315 [Deltaproteobacteria bacterium]|nr:hypothetical protein [Deltaproteobacteria bacterium]MBW2323888.1 hypothetical protein [Deltaproteobacteria bacterium]